MKLRIVALALPVLFAACADAPRTPVEPEGVALVAGRVANVSYASGTTPVTAYDPILPATAYPNWETTVCTASPLVGLSANWLNPHPAVTGLAHPWIDDYFSGAGWINAWGVAGQVPQSLGPGGHNWTKYETQVQGNGAFVIRLLADNCSWIYLDNTLVGVQGGDLSKNSYGLTLNGTHTLSFIIFDGGGASGGKFMLETTTTPPPPLDSDRDGAPNQSDVEPTRSNLYSWVDWRSADVAAGTANGIITLPGGTEITVSLRVADPAGAAPIFGYTNNGVNVGGISGFPYHDWFSSTPSTYTSPYVLNYPGFDDDIIGLAGGAESGHPLSSYVITFSPAVSDPAMAIMSLGAGGNESVYDFDRPFQVLSQGPGRFGGGGFTTGPGETLIGREGNGTIRFLGSYSTFSWTVPDGEIWHGFTIGVRGLADANADTDGDGVPDASDNCPASANSGQGDSDGDGIGDACDSANDGAADTDGDGLTNAEEVSGGTSPTNPDTDGDGVNDRLDGYPLDPTRTSRDSTPPVITPTVTGALGSNGWYTSDVAVTWTVTDAESVVTSVPCAASSVTTNTDGVTFTCSATSPGGTASESVTIKRDATAPTIAPTVSGTTGLDGWYTSDVNVSWTVADGTSGIASSSGCSLTTTTTDNDGTTYTCTATNGAGLSASESVTAKRDATQPVIGYAGNLGSYTVDQTVAITCAANDAMSGLAASTCASVSGAAVTFAIGANSFSASAADRAGNTNSATANFTVAVTDGSLCALVERFVSNKGVANSFCVKLRAKSYDAFRNELRAQGGKKFLSEAHAAILLRLVNLLG